MRLSKNTLPSVLLLVLKYIDNKFFFDQHMDLDTSFRVANIADELKMRDLERELLCKTIMLMINKQNVIQFLNTAFDKVEEKKKQYRGELVPVKPPSDSDSNRKRRKRQRREVDESGSESQSESDSDCDDVSEESEEEKAEPEMVQIDLPYD